MATDKFDVLACGERVIDAFDDVWAEASDHMKDRLHLRTGRKWDHKPSDSGVYVVFFLSDLADEKALARIKKAPGPSKRFLLFAGDLPTESIPGYIALLDVRSEKRLHLARLESQENLRPFLRRFTEALSASDDDRSVVDAWWEGDTFVVISSTFERLRVPLQALPKLGKADREDRKQFDIDEYGDFVYWPSHDVHMGWSQFQQAADPAARLRAEQKSASFNERYGRAIRYLREAANLNQRDIKGLDERTIRRIEKGGTRATCTAISKLAKAHRMTPSQYMAEVAKSLEPSSDRAELTWGIGSTADDFELILSLTRQGVMYGKESSKTSFQVF